MSFTVLDRARAGAVVGRRSAAPWSIRFGCLRNLLVDVLAYSIAPSICIDEPSPDGSRPVGPSSFAPSRCPSDARMASPSRGRCARRCLVLREPQRGAFRAGGRRRTIASGLGTSVRRIPGAPTIFVTPGRPVRSGAVEVQREFRFPFDGAISDGGVQVEVRHALQPARARRRAFGGGTRRFVEVLLRVQWLYIRAEEVLIRARHHRLQRPLHADDAAPACSGEGCRGRRSTPGSRIRAAARTSPSICLLTFDVMMAGTGLCSAAALSCVRSRRPR